MSHSPLDLKVFIRAMPGGPISPTSLCFIDMLPTEILCMIFDYFSHLTSSGRGQIPPIVLLSHISRHWRHVALGAPNLWDRLDIYNFRQPQVLRDFLSRSHNRSLIIRIDIPQTVFWSGDDIPEFDDSCRALVEQLPRIRSLSITARNLTLRKLTDKVMVGVALPHLQHLELVSCVDSAVMTMGPFRFDPRVFTSLRVEHTAIQVKDGRCLSGLQNLVYSNAPLSYLNERQIPSIAYPAVHANWYTDLPPPSLHGLADLRIHAPLLHPVPGPPPNNPVIPPPPFAPSFRTNVLQCVTLSSLSLSKMAYRAPANSDAIARFFHIISMAELTELHLIDVRDQAIEGFLWALNVHHCRFPTLRVLKLTDVPVEDIVQFREVIGLENFIDLFANAFPSLSEVHLAKLDPSPLVEMLNHFIIWPMLRQVVHDGEILLSVGFP
ncbi:hypothetical protein M378DRAFT_188166 [Amanita muscaria Koide BX008]|uniref:F-box domain-containing protein n=1 Tax=Amanita muscaria (strain Koide BX008) TaxID=946122 RepID=A0A0C2SXA4_AMAMK|nr:hypothetical protein M378DRAFT_188166 [Amanita muscaria Koide BX008]